MDDYENITDIYNDSDVDSLSSDNYSGVEEVRNSGTKENESLGQDVSTGSDYSSILADIDSDIKGIYTFITADPDSDTITLNDIHNDLKIVSCLILLFIGFYVMRSIVYKFTRRF